MIREFTASGLTAESPLSPPTGYLWKVYFILAVLSTSATAGTRGLQLGVKLGINGTNSQLYITPNGSSTAVSAVINVAGGLDIFGINGASGSGYSQWNAPLVLSAKDQILFNPGLVAGDTFGYFALVDEVISGE